MSLHIKTQTVEFRAFKHLESLFYEGHSSSELVEKISSQLPELHIVSVDFVVSPAEPDKLWLEIVELDDRNPEHREEIVHQIEVGDWIVENRMSPDTDKHVVVSNADFVTLTEGESFYSLDS